MAPVYSHPIMLHGTATLKALPSDVFHLLPAQHVDKPVHLYHLFWIIFPVLRGNDKFCFVNLAFPRFGLFQNQVQSTARCVRLQAMESFLS